jgi:hypothetical protein
MILPKNSGKTKIQKTTSLFLSRLCGALVSAVVLVSAVAAFGASNSEFDVAFDHDALTSLKPHREGGAEYVQREQRLGDVFVRWREVGQHEWVGLTNGSGAPLSVESTFAVQARAVLWTIRIQNLSGTKTEIGDLAVPLPINRSGPNRSVILKHSFISGHGSFLSWMRSDLVGPQLVLVPTGQTKLEYWEGSRQGGYRIFIHSAASGEEIKARGSSWRQPHTALMLEPKGRSGDSKTYTLKFRWADDYDAIRQVVVDEGGIDVQVVPGMTVPNDLDAELALRCNEKIHSLEAEFPASTEIRDLGKRGQYRLYQVRFSKLGENRITIHHGEDKRTFLEFFCTEPIETLIKKRAAFIARSQYRDHSKWYDGLITDWNMKTQKLLSPDDYEPIPRNRYYAVTCDDPGLGKPAFLAAKNAEFPVQGEVEALDYYIQHFVWGGLQRTTEEKYSYAVYGIPDWKTNRESADPGRTGQLHFWREYDYPHVILLYFSMYRVAKNHPEIKTTLTAKEYLQRAFGTANAFFTIPHEVWSGWSPYGTGFYNELVIVELMDELERMGMKAEADTLRSFWERKVRHFVNDREDLFRSEYAFDTTGFESTHALAKYALERMPTNNAQKFMENQMAANLFCRGCLEPAYYLLGSDIRGAGGNAYTLTYMSQMGGWSVLDYGLNFATNRAPYLRLGYASYLSAWALVNSGTPNTTYGYWYPGKSNDGAAGGGFEPSANGRMWLVPNMVLGRGSWCFGSEIDLGYSGALRTAATILADDPIFGRFCFGGDWRKTRRGIEVIPKDGLRQRFHAMLDEGEVHLTLEKDRFAAGEPIVFDVKSSKIQFRIESDSPTKHSARLFLSSLQPGKWEVLTGHGVIAHFEARPSEKTFVDLPIEYAPPVLFTIQRSNALTTK